MSQGKENRKEEGEGFWGGNEMMSQGKENRKEEGDMQQKISRPMAPE